VTRTGGGTVGLARLSLPRIDPVCYCSHRDHLGRRRLRFCDSAFFTALLDTAYTLAFAAASYTCTGAQAVHHRA
jgi:hypothetical protein